MKFGVSGKKRLALGSSGSDRNGTFEALQASLRSLFKSVFDPERGRLAVYMGTEKPESSNGSSQRTDPLLPMALLTMALLTMALLSLPLPTMALLTTALLTLL